MVKYKDYNIDQRIFSLYYTKYDPAVKTNHFPFSSKTNDMVLIK